MKARSHSKLVRFLIVGCVNTLFGYAVFALLTAIGLTDLWAVPGAMAAGIVFNFLTYGKLVFDSLDPRRMPKFLVAYLSVYTCNVLGLRALERLGVDVYVAQAILVVPMAMVVYVLNEQWVFRGA
jgi:putative flippase GtrA